MSKLLKNIKDSSLLTAEEKSTCINELLRELVDLLKSSYNQNSYNR